MSYIIENREPLIPIKLTAKGREKIATGTINWSFWSLGDSEIDYRYVNNIPVEFGKLNILKPKDNQPNLKTLVEKENCSVLNELTTANIQVVECCVRNDAKERGFFNATDNTLILNVEKERVCLTGETCGINPDYKVGQCSNEFIKTGGTVNLSQFNGTSSIDIGTVDFEDGDYILFKIANSYTGALSDSETSVPVLYLWYKISKTPLSTIISLDRNLPYFSFQNEAVVNFYIFPGGESILNYYGSGSTVPYWNSETLEFVSTCDISQEDVCVLNQNIVWNETLAGTQDEYEGHQYYGSIDYVGQKEYLGYNIDCEEIVEDTGDCEDKLLAVDDDFVKGIGIIHFSNLNISNEYGELYYINHDDVNNEQPLVIKIPTVMWHRRWFGGSGSGTELGMEFRTTGDTKLVENSGIQYYDLVEEPSLINPSGTPISVGRVFPNLKIVVIHDEELLATMSYKASRNFTLPKLTGQMISPINGIGSGVLPKGKTLYMTYVLEADNGLRYFLPHQKYIKFINNTKIDRDVNFTLQDTGLLPYMRQFEKTGYDGLGWYAHRFKILAQIVDNSEDRPDPTQWKAINYTSSAITAVGGYTINPNLFEKQDATALGFNLNKSRFNSASFYDLNNLNIPEINCTEELQFGDERFFFGNLVTQIGACIKRPTFNINIDTSDYKKTSNPTWSDGDALYFNEIGLYDSNQELIAIAKISRPVELTENTKFSLELSLDF